MNATVISALTRHILTAVGGGFFAAWGLDGESVDAVIGATATLIGVAWSVYDKKK
jgi:hypothetical protein